MTTRHRLIAGSFDAIATGRPDPVGLSVLRGGQLSKHLLMLRIIADEVRVKPSRWALSPAAASTVGAGLELLTEADRRDPAAAGRVLGYPYVGAWLVQCVRELRRSQGRPQLTHLPGIAAAAAIAVGLDFELAVWCPDGTLSLPSVGSCHPKLGTGPVRVRRRTGRTTVHDVELPSDPSLDRVGWSGLRRLTGTPDAPISVLLDDLDPYRATSAMPATGRLTRARFCRWRELFTAAWRLVCRDHHTWAAQLAELLVVLTPLQELGPAHGMSATARHAFGAVALTRPGDALGFAASLCHEHQHAKLYALLDIVELCEPPDGRMYYSPWRADPRPLLAVLHGTFAFLGVADFWQRRSAVDGDPRARYELARVRSQMKQTLDVLQGADGFTPAGHRFVTGMTTWADRLFAGPLPKRESHYAELASDDHHVTWRLRNLRPDPASVQTIADAWRRGRPVPVIPAPALEPHSEHFVQSSRARLLAAVAMDRSTRDLTEATAQLAAVHDGDVHLAHGRYDRAAASYWTALSHDNTPRESSAVATPDDTVCGAAWTGLSLARQRAADSAEATIWRNHPELVHALYCVLAAHGGTPPGPEELARWLSAAD